MTEMAPISHGNSTRRSNSKNTLRNSLPGREMGKGTLSSGGFPASTRTVVAYGYESGSRRKA